MNRVGAPRPIRLVQVLELSFHLLERIVVQQLAQFGFAEQLAQLVLIDGQRLGAPFRQRCVAVVDVVGDVAEEQGRGERRRDGRIDAHGPDLARLDAAQRGDDGGHVEDVAQALAVGLQQHRERSEARRDRQQIGGPLALLPQRAAAARPAFRQQQRPAGGLAELRGEQRRSAERLQHQFFDLVRRRDQQLRIRRLVGLRKPHDEPVVGPHRLDVEPLFGAGAFDHGHRPGGMDASAEWREHADAPVAELVPAALDEDRVIVGHDPGGSGLIGQIPHQVLRGPLIEIVMLHQPLDCSCGRQMPQRPHHLADVGAELQRPAGGLGLPERHLAGLARSRRDQHAIVRQLLDSPRRRAEQERLADAALEDHLLVELAHAGAGPALAEQEHAVEAAIRDGSRR